MHTLSFFILKNLSTKNSKQNVHLIRFCYLILYILRIKLQYIIYYIEFTRAYVVYLLIYTNKVSLNT